MMVFHLALNALQRQAVLRNSKIQMRRMFFFFSHNIQANPFTSNITKLDNIEYRPGV